jgi:hypothetical protein
MVVAAVAVVTVGVTVVAVTEVLVTEVAVAEEAMVAEAIEEAQRVYIAWAVHPMVGIGAGLITGIHTTPNIACTILARIHIF